VDIVDGTGIVSPMKNTLSSTTDVTIAELTRFITWSV